MNPLEEDSSRTGRRIRLTIGSNSSGGQKSRNGSSSPERGSRRQGRLEWEVRSSGSPTGRRDAPDWEREGSGDASEGRTPSVDRGWRNSFAGAKTGPTVDEPLLLSPQRSLEAESLSPQPLLSATKSISGGRWVDSGSFSPRNPSFGSPTASPSSLCLENSLEGGYSIDLMLTNMTAADDLRREIIDYVASAELDHRRAVMKVENSRWEKLQFAFHQTHPLNQLHPIQETPSASPSPAAYSIPVRSDRSLAGQGAMHTANEEEEEAVGGRGEMPVGLLWSARLLSAILCILSLTSTLLPFRTAHFPKAPYKDSPIVMYLYKLEVPYAEARNYSYPEDISLFDFPPEFRSWRPLLPSRAKAPSIGVSYDLDEMLKLSTISGLCISTIALACSVQCFFTLAYVFHRSPVFVWAHLTAGLTNFLGLVAYYLTIIRTDSLLTNADSSEWAAGLYVAATACLVSVLVPTFGFLCCGLHFDPRWIVRPQQALNNECPQFPWPWHTVKK
jgi:hypothetical protein